MDIPKILSGLPLIYEHIPDFDIDEVVKHLGSRIVPTSGKDYVIAQHKDDPSDCSDRTDYFDWHSDGLYYTTPPRFVLLHCLDPGSGQGKTELASVFYMLDRLSEDTLYTLNHLRSHYIGHGGCFDHRILYHGGMLLASRGYVSPLPDLPLEDIPSIRSTSDALMELYDALGFVAVPYTWRAGDTLIFDQYQYLHRRNSCKIDKDRKLIRLWFN